MELNAFVERVLGHVPASPPSKFVFSSWSHAGRPTKEGFGMMPIPGVEPDKVVAAVLDVDHYVGNIDHVGECRSIADPRFEGPDQVRFYQKLEIPVVGKVQHELVLRRLEPQQGYALAGWEILRAETDALSKKQGVRSDYCHGLWLAKPGLIGYALGSAPKRDDVGFLKWKALTAGADVAASRVLKTNLEAMARFAARR